MRMVRLGLVIWITAAMLCGAGCSEEPIGQPCTFNWPVNAEDETICEDYPACAPLQDTGGVIGDEPANTNCPVDCIQLPSLECTNLICVATQVESSAEVDGATLPREQLMNGQCSADVVRTECTADGEAAFGCMGYCTKECLSDASCPKGYRCARMAPFGENLRCDDETLWGDGGGDSGLQCTDSCLPTGTDLGGGDVCPASDAEDPDYSVCDLKEYRRCCSCLCYRFCPLLTKKFCRKVDWDQKLFPNGYVSRDTKICSDQE